MATSSKMSSLKVLIAAQHRVSQAKDDDIAATSTLQLDDRSVCFNNDVKKANNHSQTSKTELRDSKLRKPNFGIPNFDRTSADRQAREFEVGNRFTHLAAFSGAGEVCWIPQTRARV